MRDEAQLGNFHELIAWQKARAVTREVYDFTRRPEVRRDFGYVSQIQRAVSVMSNIAEGYERGGRAEFHQFLTTAKASCAEVRSLLVVGLDVGYLDPAEFDRLTALAEEAPRVTGGLRMAVRRQRDAERPGGQRP